MRASYLRKKKVIAKDTRVSVWTDPVDGLVANTIDFLRQYPDYNTSKLPRKGSRRFTKLTTQILDISSTTHYRTYLIKLRNLSEERTSLATTIGEFVTTLSEICAPSKAFESEAHIPVLKPLRFALENYCTAVKEGTEAPVVYNLACGTHIEQGLIQYLFENPIVFAVDNNERLLRRASNQSERLEIVNEHIEAADATDPNYYTGKPDADVVLILHQAAPTLDGSWVIDMLLLGYDKLRPGGQMIITSFDELEEAQLLNRLKAHKNLPPLYIERVHNPPRGFSNEQILIIKKPIPLSGSCLEQRRSTNCNTGTTRSRKL